jgi:hypothetical protein
MWKAEVIADSTGEWCGNRMRFKTQAEAEAYVFDLAMRWTAVRDTRVVECGDDEEASVVTGIVPSRGRRRNDDEAEGLAS